MSVYFFDSSSMLKRYVAETGTNWVRTATLSSVGNEIFIAQITLVELAAAIARRKREKSISQRTAKASLLLIDRHARREWFVIPLSGQIVKRAQDLSDTHPLRAYDAVQLASALEANTRLIAANQPPLTFVCADTRLLTVATSEACQHTIRSSLRLDVHTPRGCDPSAH